MTSVLEEIEKKIIDAESKPSFLSVLFGSNLDAILAKKKSVIIFGSGALGRELGEMLDVFGIDVECFLDNDTNKLGVPLLGKLVVSLDSNPPDYYADKVIVIGVQKAVTQVFQQLINANIDESLICCSPKHEDTNFIYMYSMIGSRTLMHIYREQLPNGDVWAMMKERQADIDKVYNLLADDKSKQLFVSKMALIGSDKSFHLFKEFILNHSEPYQEFGAFNYDGTPEDYYYFNNNVITLDDGEVFLDVGAFDGDTIEMFVDTCNKASISYKHIYAVEPDPPCYEALKVNTSKYENVTYHQIGFGQEEMDVSFMASDVEEHFNVGIQSETGNISIHIVRMDDFIFNEDPTFIKMDPGQNVIPDILAGAKETITSYKPKLALGAYHSCMALFEIPLHVHNLCPEYKIYLRHGTYHLADTDMFAHI